MANTDTQNVDLIAQIIGNQAIASDIIDSISYALGSPYISFEESTVWGIFKQSLDASIRDIDTHPRGKLFTRLIEYGPPNPDVSEKVLASNDETTLSDPECGICVEFIFSHMVNRFKGELAELLALKPCLQLIEDLAQENRIPSKTQLFWGSDIFERYKKTSFTNEERIWGNFTKGADGLIAEQLTDDNSQQLSILGIIEIKSKAYSNRKILRQIDNHIKRLEGGLKTGEYVWDKNSLILGNKNASGVHRVMVVPSTWKLSREWSLEKIKTGNEMRFPRLNEAPIQTNLQELGNAVWKISLQWSAEALEQAAYEMTFWYMSQVGAHIYSKKSLPKEWEHMDPDEAGYNSIKMMLYYILLRHISVRQERLATKLYNVYSFGYPLGIDSREMLWPEDFKTP